MKEIEELSAQLKSGAGRVCGPQSVRCTVFPEGSTVSISMEIVVNGVPKVVLWGSMAGSVTGGRPVSSLETEGRGAFSERARWKCGNAFLPGDRVSFCRVSASRHGPRRITSSSSSRCGNPAGGFSTIAKGADGAEDSNSSRY